MTPADALLGLAFNQAINSFRSSFAGMVFLAKGTNEPPANDDRVGRLKLRDLHIFMTVAQQGSMGRAATHLAVSQPVVSKAISDLERTLKVRLVDPYGEGRRADRLWRHVAARGHRRVR